MRADGGSEAAEAASVRERLAALSEPAYGDFMARLLPTLAREELLGVRTPVLRRFAAELWNGDRAAAESFLGELPHHFFEENMLHGFLIDRLRGYEETLEALERYLPFLRCWAESDSLMPKLFRKHREELYESGRIQDWLQSENVYAKRFGMNVLMSCYLEEYFRPEMPEQVLFSLNKFYRDRSIRCEEPPQERSDDYYLRMMTAWYFATAMAKQEKAVLPYLESRLLDPWTHNKTIQKCIESFRVDGERKQYLRTLRIAKSAAQTAGGGNG